MWVVNFRTESIKDLKKLFKGEDYTIKEDVFSLTEHSKNIAILQEEFGKSILELRNIEFESWIYEENEYVEDISDSYYENGVRESDFY